MPRLDFFSVFTNKFFHNFPFKSKCILKIINIFPERKAAFYQLKFAPARVYKFHEKERESLSLSLDVLSSSFSTVSMSSILPVAFSCLNIFSLSNTPYK